MSFDLLFVKLEKIGKSESHILGGKRTVLFLLQNNQTSHVFIIYEVNLYLK